MCSKNWLLLSHFTPHSFNISVCASLLQIKTYSHMYVAYLTLPLLSQEFSLVNLYRCTRNQGPPWVGWSGSGGWEHDPGARKEPPDFGPHRACKFSFVHPCIYFAQTCFGANSYHGSAGQAPWPQSSAFRVGQKKECNQSYGLMK